MGPADRALGPRAHPPRVGAANGEMMAPVLVFILLVLSSAFPSTTSALAPVATLSSAASGAAGKWASLGLVGFACGAEKTPAAALTCLLGGLTFNIPPIHVPDIKDGIALDIDSLACKNFALSDLDVAFSTTGGGSARAEQVKATLEGGNVACEGDIKLSHVPVVGSLSAHAKVGLSKLQLVEADIRNGGADTVRASQGPIPHPELPTVHHQCPLIESNSDLSLTLSLSGSFVADIVNLIGSHSSKARSARPSSRPSKQRCHKTYPSLSDAINVSRLVRPFLDLPRTRFLQTSQFPPDVKLPNVIRWDEGIAGEIFPSVSKILSDVSEDGSPLLSHVLDFLDSSFRPGLRGAIAPAQQDDSHR